MAGTWICRTTFMHTATGSVVLNAPDGCFLLGPGSGTIQIPFASDGFIYLDGSGSPTNIADLPAGFTVDSAFSLDHVTTISAAGDEADYTIPFTPTVPAAITALNPTGLWLSEALTGATSLAALAGFDMGVAITSVSGGLVVLQNLALGVWDPTYNISLSGTYTTAVPAVLAVSPNVGTVAGGQAVAITGTGFTGATVVEFGGIAATAVVVVNDELITAVTPAHESGVVDVEVIGVGTLTDGYLYAIPRRKLPPLPIRTPIKQGDDPANKKAVTRRG